MRASDDEPGSEPAPAGPDLSASARGWHGVQLAVLGFIGLCGVLNGMSDSGSSRWLQVLAGLLVLAALVLQCVAVVSVATVAWPLREQTVSAEQRERTRSRLRNGIATTFVAVVFLAVATSLSWWPGDGAEAARVQVEADGRTLCGQLRDSDAGRIALDVDGQTVVIALADVTRLLLVESCA